MKRWAVILGCLLLLAVVDTTVPTGLPVGFVIHEETDYGGIGGGLSRDERFEMKHHPIIFVPDNRCSPFDWLDKESSNSACRACDVHGRFRMAGFAPIELWYLRIMPDGKQWNNIEEHTDDLRHFLFSVLKYTGAPKVQIVAHGAGAVLTHYTMKKYNLYNLVHAVAYLGGPMHGTDRCDWIQCFSSQPICCSLTPGALLLNDMLLPAATPFNVAQGARGRRQIKYLTVRNGRPGGDEWFLNNQDSPKLPGAVNRLFPGLDHEGLRCSDEVLAILLPFLSDSATSCRDEEDQDGDGFCDEQAGGADCDDRSVAVYPGASEICEDGIDQDCNGFDFQCDGGRDLPLADQPPAL